MDHAGKWNLAKELLNVVVASTDHLDMWEQS
jgi:hypothetical protein